MKVVPTVAFKMITEEGEEVFVEVGTKIRVAFLQ